MKATQKEPITIATAAANLEQATENLDKARIALSAAEAHYTKACSQFDNAVAETRKSNSR
jgi:hypothetical protein